MSAAALPSTYKAVAATSKGKLEMVDRPMPEVTGDQVLIKVEACGVCHSDSFTVNAMYPGVTFPRVPGHETIGIVKKKGERATRVQIGDRVGRGWHGGHCFTCNTCRSGNFVHCEKEVVSGVHDDGGYAEYMIAPEASFAPVPEGIDAVKAASLMCAGVTTFNGLRQQHILPPGVVVVLGIGGLGHLAIQFARKMGYYTIAVSRSADKEKDAIKFGAHKYLASERDDVVKELKALGGAACILSTLSGKQTGQYNDGLAVNGKLISIGADMEKIDVTPMQLIGSGASVIGHASGTAYDSEETMKFAKLFGVEAQTEVFKFTDFQKAYDRGMSGKAQFRVIMKMD